MPHMQRTVVAAAIGIKILVKGEKLPHSVAETAHFSSSQQPSPATVPVIKWVDAEKEAGVVSSGRDKTSMTARALSMTLKCLISS
ncbi:hypothetical protein QUB16_03360 [Microcoleus sp. D3_18a_C4]